VLTKGLIRMLKLKKGDWSAGKTYRIIPTKIGGAT
jgi:hypothetical protein